jgi:hypothetical protein
MTEIKVEGFRVDSQSRMIEPMSVVFFGSAA